LGDHYAEEGMMVSAALSTQYRNATDRQSDGRTDRQNCYNNIDASCGWLQGSMVPYHYIDEM